jgi:hypothetical protein
MDSEVTEAAVSVINASQAIKVAILKKVFIFAQINRTNKMTITYLRFIAEV